MHKFDSLHKKRCCVRVCVCGRLLHEDGGRKVLRPVESVVRLHRVSRRTGGARRLSSWVVDGYHQLKRHADVSPTSR